MSSQAEPPQPPPVPLLRLPPELRNRIWRLLLKPTAIEIYPAGRDGRRIHARRTYKYTHFSHGYPYLLETCHQIRNEGSAIYFEENTFSFTKDAVTEPCIRTFERWSGLSADRVKRVEVEQSFEVAVNAAWIKTMRYSARWVVEMDEGLVEVQETAPKRPHEEGCVRRMQLTARAWNNRLFRVWAQDLHEQDSPFAFLRCLARVSQPRFEAPTGEFAEMGNLSEDGNLCGRIE